MTRASHYLDFAVRTFIVAFAAYLVVSALFMAVFRTVDRLNALLARVDAQIERLDGYARSLAAVESQAGFADELADVRVRLQGLGTNPEVHYEIALRKEQRGDLVGAARELRFALGLLAPDANKYRREMEKVQARLPAKP